MLSARLLRQFLHRFGMGMGALSLATLMGNANDIINDRIDGVSKGFLGLPVTCARCHGHKFDPIPQQDYCSLRGIFASSVEPVEPPLLAPIKMSDDHAKFSKESAALKTGLTTLRAQNPRTMTGEPRQKWFRDQTRLVQQIGLLETTSPGTPARAMVMVDRTRPADSPVYLRGAAENRGAVTTACAPAAAACRARCAASPIEGSVMPTITS